MSLSSAPPLLEARNLTKRYGRVIGLAGVDLTLASGEVLAIVGDNGAGKSTLIKCLSGALSPDAGEILVNGNQVRFRRPQDAREAGIETVFQTLAISPALDIASNIFLARELRRPGVLGSVFRMLDKRRMQNEARDHVRALGISTLQNIEQTVETLSGGQRQAVAVARAAAFGSQIVILDEPTAALGVRESAQVISLINDLRDAGLGVILISHDMRSVFDVANRVQIQRLGRCSAVLRPGDCTMEDIIAYMTGARTEVFSAE